MAQATDNNITSKLDNFSNEMLADLVGEADSAKKAAEARLAELKTELQHRNITEAAGENFAISIRVQVSTRIDTSAVRAFLGDAVARFETSSIASVLRVKTVHRFVAAAA
jgi:predicted phage-related endonuclease